MNNDFHICVCYWMTDCQWLTVVSQLYRILPYLIWFNWFWTDEKWHFGQHILYVHVTAYNHVPSGLLTFLMPKQQCKSSSAMNLLELWLTVTSSQLYPLLQYKAQNTGWPTSTTISWKVTTRYNNYTATITVTSTKDQATHSVTDTLHQDRDKRRQPSACRIPALAVKVLTICCETSSALRVHTARDQTSSLTISHGLAHVIQTPHTQPRRFINLTGLASCPKESPKRLQDFISWMPFLMPNQQRKSSEGCRMPANTVHKKRRFSLVKKSSLITPFPPVKAHHFKHHSYLKSDGIDSGLSFNLLCRVHRLIIC